MAWLSWWVWDSSADRVVGMRMVLGSLIISNAISVVILFLISDTLGDILVSAKIALPVTQTEARFYIVGTLPSSRS